MVRRGLGFARLTPAVLGRLFVRRASCAISLCGLCVIASLPRDWQPGRVFG